MAVSLMDDGIEGLLTEIGSSRLLDFVQLVARLLRFFLIGPVEQIKMVLMLPSITGPCLLGLLCLLRLLRLLRLEEKSADFEAVSIDWAELVLPQVFIARVVG